MPVDRPPRASWIGRVLLVADPSVESRRELRDALGEYFEEIVELEDGRALRWMLEAWARRSTADGELVVLVDAALATDREASPVDLWRLAARLGVVVALTGDEADRRRARAFGVEALERPVDVAWARRLLVSLLRR